MQNKQEKIPTYPIGSVNNALRLLLMFRDHPLIRVSEAGTALGVAPGRLRELYPSPRIEGRTPRSIRTRAALEAELARVRDLGFAVNLGESEPDVGAVGVAVRDTLGHPRAALAISAPLSRIQGQRVPELAEALKRTSGDAAAGLA